MVVERVLISGWINIDFQKQKVGHKKEQLPPP